MPFIGTQPAESALTTGHLGADIVTNAKIADDQIDSEHYVDGSIDTAHIGNTQITTGKIATNAIDGTLTKDALIADYSDVTITASDLIMYGDATDSNNTKRDTVQGILDLAGGGAWQYITTVTISADTEAEFTSTHITTTYDTYMIDCINVFNSSANYTGQMFTSTDNGTSYRSSGYMLTNFYMNSSAAGPSDTGSSTNKDKILLHGDSDNALADSWSSQIFIHNPMNASVNTTIRAVLSAETAAAINIMYLMGCTITNEAINNVKINHNSGNTSGTFRLYGLSKT